MNALMPMLKHKEDRPFKREYPEQGGNHPPHDITSNRDSPLEILPANRDLVPLDPLNRYLLDIRRYELLSREEEVELAIRVREENDERAAYRLVTSNLRLVVKIAMGFQRSWTQNLLDLVQEGNVGLVLAVRKFDPFRGTKLSYYASFWIKAYMIKFMMENMRLIKIGTTQNQRKLFFNLAKEKQKMRAEGLTPEPGLLAERLDVRKEDVVEMSQRLGGRDISVNSPARDDSRETYDAILPDSSRALDERLSGKQGRETLAKKLKKFRKTLSGREADVFDRRIMAENPVTLQNLGYRHQISRERVRQIQLTIVEKAEKWLKEEIPNFEEEYAGFAG